MSQVVADAHVSLHPVASRHGGQSSTRVAVKVPTAAPPSSSSLFKSKQRSAAVSRARGVSPKSRPARSKPSVSSPKVYGIQHADLDDFPTVYEDLLRDDLSSNYEDDDEDDVDIVGGPACAEDADCLRSMQRSIASPIRAMSASQFAQLHEQYVSLDVPHSVVFPFLHGVDGSIPAQNAFFGAPMNGQPAPNYRGLTVIRADMPSLEEAQRMQAAARSHRRSSASPPLSSATRARARTFSSVTTQSSGSSPDSDEDAQFDTTWHPNRSNPVPVSGLGNGAADGTLSTPDQVMRDATDRCTLPATCSESATSVASTTSRPSLFSISSENYSSSSRTSVSTVSDVAPDEPTKADLHSHSSSGAASNTFRREAPKVFEPQPRHSVLNSTVFPSEVIRPPSITRSMYGRNVVYGDLSSPGSLGEEDDGASSEYRRNPPSFLKPPQASGVSLRNFKIQCAKYATISDVVIYCPFGYHPGVLTLAKWVREAQASVRRERLQRGWGGLRYNVFVVTDSFDVFERHFPHLIATDSRGCSRNTVDFFDRERDEMKRLTRASEIDDNVWLGCTADAPGGEENSDEWGDNEPVTPDEDGNPNSFSICVRVNEVSELPTLAHLRSASHYLDTLESTMQFEADCAKGISGLHHGSFDGSAVHVRDNEMRSSTEGREGMLVLGPNGWTPKPYACSVQGDLAAASRFQSTREGPGVGAGTGAVGSRLVFGTQVQDRDGRGPLRLDASSVVHVDFLAGGERSNLPGNEMAHAIIEICGWIQQQACPPVADTTPSSSPTRRSPSSSFSTLSSTLRSYRSGGAASPVRSMVSNERTSGGANSPDSRSTPRSRRPRRVLLHCTDGYTETSVLALAYLMYSRGLSLPEAYLDLQIRANRSFFVYPNEVPLLERIERVLQRTRAARATVELASNEVSDSRRARHVTSKSFSGPSTHEAAQLLDDRRLSLSSPVSSQRTTADVASAGNWVVDHSWFDKSRFDGSFPSRILPFLYLGNLAHASNVDMLRVLGITHLVSVGETALAPPDHISAKVNHGQQQRGDGRYQRASARAALSEDPSTVPSLTYQTDGISVLNVRNVSDDGIDSLRPTMREAVQFIEAARLAGGKVLVHCRVGVSRSSTIVLAYVMAHLDLGLVESYLLVRSRRLNIVIQPHLLFLWELRGWESYLQRAKQIQASALETRNGRAGVCGRQRELSREASFALSALSLRSCSGRNMEIGAGAGSAHGFAVTDSASRKFGCGSPAGLPYDSTRMVWGHLCREIADLNSRYFF
ncbi:hypothetical protein BCV70DRAFT_159727 [Testicularia cyperi]|uniref:Uncharacterized protein n=1 Tax=Testicularia cyperi TaxID=1882483 RepID=A0A317XRW4_9BASI|nr:hypothetical protein BCV70DRAFT_159727 [Testicularia cyperi]